MKDLPYFKWYPADAESDEAYSLMSNAEIGFFHRCLNRSWVNDGLPSEINQLARLLGQSVASTNKLWMAVGSRFQLEDGRYRNRRQEEERMKARTKSERASESVRTRYEKSTNVGTNDVLRAVARADSDSDSDSSVAGFRKGVQGETKPPDDFLQPGPDEYAHRLVYGDPGASNGLAEQHWTLSDPRLCVVAARNVFIGAADPPGVLSATREQHAKYREYHAAHPKIRGKPLQWWLSDGQYLVAPPNGDGGRKSRFD